MWHSNMTDEYYLAVTSFNLSWDELVHVGRTSLEFAFLPEREKRRLIEDYERDIAAFEARFARGDWRALAGRVPARVSGLRSASSATAMKRVVLGTLAVIAIAVGAAVIGGLHWDSETRAIVDELESSGRVTPRPYSTDGLPEPVVRYFENVFPGEPPRGRHLRLTQEGEFRMSADENSWRPFTATQHIDVGAPGFVWDARIQMAPLVQVRVRDAYINGRGMMLGKVAAVVPVVDAHDKEELSSGALLRYLAEAAWFPTALLPSESLRWRAVDENGALATLFDAGREVTATFYFDDAGDVVRVTADRYREVDGEYVLTPWAGRFWNHAVRSGTRIPLEGEVGWQLEDGLLIYWRGTIVGYEVD